MDFKYDKIFNGWIVIGILLGYFIRIQEGGWHSAGVGCISMTLSFLLLYPVYKIRGLGAGDVKLLMMVGTFTSVEEVLHVIILSFLIGAVFSIGKIVSERNLEKGSIKEINMEKRNKIHFALPVCISVMLMSGGML